MTFLSWLVDDNYFHIVSDYNARKCIAVVEMIISLHKNNFTPFNLGLTLQLYHGYESKNLIETLHTFGICASYTEVRQFLSCAANHEIAKTEVSCIPYGISPKTLGGDFIQEGADNIDLNTETIDGKNTMHSMARAVFQVVQDYTPTSEISSTKIKRGQDRSLSMTEETTSLMACLPYRNKLVIFIFFVFSILKTEIWTLSFFWCEIFLDAYSCCRNFFLVSLRIWFKLSRKDIHILNYSFV
jgi:hypothetical protein